MISLRTFAITTTSESRLAYEVSEEPVIEGGFEAVYHGTTSPAQMRQLVLKSLTLPSSKYYHQGIFPSYRASITVLNLGSHYIRSEQAFDDVLAN
jgi:hypothetical protein